MGTEGMVTKGVNPRGPSTNTNNSQIFFAVVSIALSLGCLGTQLSQVGASRAVFKVGLGIFRTNVDSQWNPVYKAFHRVRCCENETNLR